MIRNEKIMRLDHIQSKKKRRTTAIKFLIAALLAI